MGSLKLTTASSGSVILSPENTASDVTVTIPATTATMVTTAATQTLTNKTLTSPTINTPVMGGSVITSGTSVSASGTSIDFTGIPSWVKRITVVYSSLSTNGGSALIVQLGDSGGIETTGYLGSGVFSGPSTGSGNSTVGLLMSGGSSASTVSFHGSMIISKLTGNTWSSICISGQSDSTYAAYAGGSKALSDTLDRIRITTGNGTDSYDAGTINILYE